MSSIVVPESKSSLNTNLNGNHFSDSMQFNDNFWNLFGTHIPANLNIPMTPGII